MQLKNVNILKEIINALLGLFAEVLSSKHIKNELIWKTAINPFPNSSIANIFH